MHGYDTARVLDGALGEDTKLLDGDTLSNQMGKGTNYDSPRGRWKFDEQGPLQNVYLRKVQDTGGALANAVVFDLGVAGQPNALMPVDPSGLTMYCLVGRVMPCRRTGRTCEEQAERFAALFRALYLTYHRRDGPRSDLPGRVPRGAHPPRGRRAR